MEYRGVAFGHGVFHNLVRLQHIVERDDAAFTQKRQTLLVVAGIAAFIGVDKGKIELFGFPVRDHPGQSVAGRADAQVDLPVDAGFRPIFPRDIENFTS